MDEPERIIKQLPKVFSTGGNAKSVINPRSAQA